MRTKMLAILLLLIILFPQGQSLMCYQCYSKACGDRDKWVKAECGGLQPVCYSTEDRKGCIVENMAIFNKYEFCDDPLCNAATRTRLRAAWGLCAGATALLLQRLLAG